MTHMTRTLRFYLYGSCCSVFLLAQAAQAQTNSGQAPLLPPPPTEALQPIDAPLAEQKPKASDKPAEKTSAADKSSEKTPVAKTTPANNMGTTSAAKTPDVATPPASEKPVETAAEKPAGLTPVLTTPATEPAVVPINPQIPPVSLTGGNGLVALPGMPGSEAALNAATNSAATTSINPALIGAGSNGLVDDAAYEALLKERTEKIKAQTRQRAIEQANENAFPMTPEEIQDVIRKLRSTQAAIQKPIESPPTPRAVVHTMELDPGALPPTIQLLNGNVTSLTILDATGQPWPIVDIAFGGPFDVKPPESGGHIIRISPLKEYARGNMSIRLQKLATPITFSLEAGGTEVHYRFDARIPQMGPHAKTQLIDRGLAITAGTDAYLSSILVGTPPPSAERLKVSGVDGRTSAYRINGATYVRTPHTLLSPTWQSSASSADGTNVYMLNDAPVVLLSDNGTMVRAQIQMPLADPLGLPEDRKLPGLTQNNAGGRG